VWSRHTVGPSATEGDPPGAGSLRLVEPAALSPVLIPQVWSSRIHLPGALCSAGVTRLRRSYGSSDSCGALPGAPQVSLRHVFRLPAIPPPTTWCSPSSLWHATPQRDGLPFPVWASPLGSRLAETPGRIEFTRVADWPFAFRYSPPRLTATQFRSATSRRASTWKGLPPF